MEDVILDIDRLTLKAGDMSLVSGISLKLERGKFTGLAGESGSGKTLTALSVLGLLPPAVRMTSGSILFSPQHGPTVDLATLPPKIMHHIRGYKISMIFQEPMTSLNPSMRCGDQVTEVIRLHLGEDRRSVRSRVLKLFGEVRLPDPRRAYRAWPHQLSGGQRQRVMIAMALATSPELVIADEPTTALDVTVQKSILDLLAELRVRYRLTILFITHDLMVLKQIADRMVIMYRGQVVESGSTGQILTAPSEPYTKGLIACKPGLDRTPYRLPTLADFMAARKPETRTLKRTEIIPGAVPLLSIRNLNKWYSLHRGKTFVKAVRDVSFDVYRGETLGLVGESGCGKTTLGRTILRLIEATSGDIDYRGENLRAYSRNELRRIRRKVQVVFQDPYSSLSPRRTAGQIIREPMDIHKIGPGSAWRTARTEQLLEQVGLSAPDMGRYPHEFSGGQRQRIGIARALACEPEFVILDEAVSALDVSVQAQILNLLNELKQAYRLTYIFISHDLTVVRYMSDRILVMKDGSIVETGTAESIFAAPGHPYTGKLIRSIPG
jgi:peptide/nickel transport system ATP-binding protein